jgi:hypothetical protein
MFVSQLRQKFGVAFGNKGKDDCVSALTFPGIEARLVGENLCDARAAIRQDGEVGAIPVHAFPTDDPIARVRAMAASLRSICSMSRARNSEDTLKHARVHDPSPRRRFQCERNFVQHALGRSTLHDRRFGQPDALGFLSASVRSFAATLTGCSERQAAGLARPDGRWTDGP